MSDQLRVPVDANELTAVVRSAFGVEGEWHFGITRESGWADMDLYGHVNHLAYLHWCQECRNRYFRMALGEWPSIEEIGPVIRSVEFTYDRALGIGDRVLVTARIEKLGHTSCVQRYAVWHDGLVGSGNALCVFISLRTGEKVPIPENFRASVTALERLG
ncbi:acyl-CoA thioesterase [Pseudaminobacter arsenicus]|uniref:Acyl-CoA thioesterase n=1 Tax=Borborobacter arsenicus TaxID=1851146 RepID=A0A432V1H5_9HYPH|nr:thioesterase family protein [Pseudaminobacter arsenicus]RUM96026.1 acyl-CoA thioesterase [Pseudaminobacter arsenicus]